MWVTVLQSKVPVDVIFDGKYFYGHLSAINSNVDFIINSIDFQYNTIQAACTLINIANKNMYLLKIPTKNTLAVKKVVAKT